MRETLPPAGFPAPLQRLGGEPGGHRMRSEQRRARQGRGAREGGAPLLRSLSDQD